MRQAHQQHNIRAMDSQNASMAFEVLGPALHPISDEARRSWLQEVAKASVPQGYAEGLKRWVESFDHTNARVFELRSEAPLSVGRGLPSLNEIGVHLHRTWGTPLIPGSALKGLLASYIEARYGPDSSAVHPLDPGHPDPERAPWQGTHWVDRSIKHGPGSAIRAIFGAPSADSDREWGEAAPATDNEVGAVRGQVVFHDALYSPSHEGERFLYLDVITPHVTSSWNTVELGGGAWPNEYESPVPVPFVAVRPGSAFAFALSGPPDLTELVTELLLDALAEVGVGAKTSSGYGWFDPESKVILRGPSVLEEEKAQEEVEEAREDVAPRFNDLEALLAGLQEAGKTTAERVAALRDELKPWSSEPASHQAEFARMLLGSAQVGKNKRWKEVRAELVAMTKLTE